MPGAAKLVPTEVRDQIVQKLMRMGRGPGPLASKDAKVDWLYEVAEEILTIPLFTGEQRLFNAYIERVKAKAREEGRREAWKEFVDDHAI